MTDTKVSGEDFVQLMTAQINRRAFIGKLLVIVFGYVVLTAWLNSIRATAPMFFVVLLIIIQYLFYFGIFTASYGRLREIGSKYAHLVIFIVLAVLGRVNDWEWVVLPVVVLGMLWLSGKKTAAA